MYADMGRTPSDGDRACRYRTQNSSAVRRHLQAPQMKSSFPSALCVAIDFGVSRSNSGDLYSPTTVSSNIKFASGVVEEGVSAWRMQVFTPATPRPVGGWASTRRLRICADEKKAIFTHQYYKRRGACGMPPCSRGDPREPIGGPQGSRPPRPCCRSKTARELCR